MNTHTFDNHYVTCPICQKNATPKPVKTCIGLFTCPYCQERLVVSQSGHYVRDPFTYKQQIPVSSSLRRQSRPLARILRDFVFLKYPFLALILGGAILLGVVGLTQQSTTSDSPTTKMEKQE
ncbi:MAG: hypothetical protein SAK29_26065 [Scytonema sp. PMC 1069.18]|nr:hypothetical protein [Scytonema sp. PMC 1069.18]MEC4885736.1 hypothetical protein [Scytonema sp. PMC 1070.18]